MRMSHRPYRRTIRLQDFTYRGATYFVTITAFMQRCIFAAPRKLSFTAVGRVVEEEWLRTPVVRCGVALDDFVIMPNHMHALVYIPEDRTLSTRIQKSLATLVAGFKAAVTSRAHSELQFHGRVWQRNYYEHVIRSTSELERARRYIKENPQRWIDRRKGLLTR